ncbi:MAG: ATP-binding cassette domain-containing protein, partial [Candidatus Micrarchaeia archaeon]
PTSGNIYVNGIDVHKNPEKIKKSISVMTQETVVEPDLTARENLQLFADLYELDKATIPSKIDSALEEVDLKNFSDVPAGTFSGGMQRRLGLTKSMLNDPQLLILDEPTTGLDVQNRVNMWNQIERLNSERGMTLILTTQYLEEADALCDRIAIIDHGTIKAIGTPVELKRMAAEGLILEMIASKEDAAKAAELLKNVFKLEAKLDEQKINAVVSKENIYQILKDISLQFSKEKIELYSISIHLPTLDDVFIKLTGSGLRDSTGENVSRMDLVRARR